ncbi:MAG: PRC-barrel domain-containing protein [Desulfobacterales bacterium]
MKRSMFALLTVFTMVVFVLVMTGPAWSAEHKEGAYEGKDKMAGMEKEGAIGQGMTRADKLIGHTVNDQQGNELGEIKDLVIDEQGRISYLVLSRGGVVGIGAELVPIPYDQVDVQMAEDEITMQNIDQAKLERAPSFNEDEWQKLSQSSFETEVRGYFGESGQTQQPGMMEERDQMQEPGMMEEQDRMQEPGMME